MTATFDQSNPSTRVATPIPEGKVKTLDRISSLSTLDRVSSRCTTVVTEFDHEDGVLAKTSTARKVALMAMFSAAQFLDVFNNRYVHTVC